MDVKIQQQIENIYYKVLEKKPDDVKGFVSKLANKNSEIINGVMELLAVEEYQTYNQTSNKFIENISDLIEDNFNQFESDRYKLIRKIGEGGMGSVYLASRVDDEVEHQVAIKILNSAFTSAANIERFKKERQIIAHLDHENIARFIDAGSTDSGMLFVVMEYIQGSTIKEYCKQNQLNLEQKLTLFLQLCHAVDYAHKHFIIHRDIKPANILVTNSGKLKLLDFGIAKLFDDSQQQTEATATKIMTPAYASPEQLLGKRITIQSDLYALGVVLFEMIIGVRPFQDIEKDTHSFNIKVIKGLTAKPSQLITPQSESKPEKIAEINNDIDALLTKAINPNVKYRYEMVSELSGDINSYLTGFPIKARKPNKWYFYQLFIKRNKVLVSLSTLSLSAIIAFSIFSLIQNKELKKKSIEVSMQRDEAVLQAKKAKLASDFLLDSFQEADPTRTFGEQLTIKQVMESSFEKLKKYPLKDKQLSAELYHTISKAFYGMNSLKPSIDAAKIGLSLLPKNNISGSVLKVKLLLDNAKGFYANQNYQKSLMMLDEAINICDLILINDCLLDEIYMFLAKNNKKIGKEFEAVKFMNLGLNWLEFKNINGARYLRFLSYFANLENSLSHYEKVELLLNEIDANIEDNDKEIMFYKLEARIEQVKLLRKKKKFSQAENIIYVVVEEIINNFGMENYLYVKALTIKALIDKSMTRYFEAIKAFKKCIDIKQKLNLNYSFDLNKIGNIYYHDLKDYNNAIIFYKRAISLSPKDTNNLPNDYAFYKRNLAFAYYQLSRYENALILFIEARELFKRIVSTESQTLENIDEWIDFLTKELKK